MVFSKRDSIFLTGHRSIQETLIQEFGYSKDKAAQKLFESGEFARGFPGSIHWAKVFLLMRFGVEMDTIGRNLSILRFSLEGKLVRL